MRRAPLSSPHSRPPCSSVKLRIRSQCQQFVPCEEEGEEEEVEKEGNESMLQQEQDKAHSMEMDQAGTISPPLDFSLPTQPATAGEAHHLLLLQQGGPFILVLVMVYREGSRRHC